MKIVQTFWSGKGNPLIDSYSWLEPQYHLMSWALSCLSLRKYYDDVVLYTDSTGFTVFSELLGLPYTDIIVQYDDLKCPKHQWAYSKMLTYSLQDKPFMHVDGDVYLPKRFDMAIEKGEIITQNKEIGTRYYRTMIDRILTTDIVMPDFLHKELQKESISSYNAGIFGGNNIDFIQRYCEAAFDYINTNHLLDTSNITRESHNILFEQILLYAIARNENRSVTTVLDQDVPDNGYSYANFCDFYSFDDYTLMHIIGGHKKRQKTCDLLAKTLLNKYPKYYQRIIELFPGKHKRIQKQLVKSANAESYSDCVERLMKRWRKISYEDLFDMEQKSCNYFEFLNHSYENQLITVIKRNPYLFIYEKSKNQRFKFDEPKSDMACIPTLLNSGFQEISIDDLSYNILTILTADTTFEDLLNELQQCFSMDIRKDKDLVYYKTKEKLEYLFYNNLIYIDVD